jgi:hypothetical protein
MGEISLLNINVLLVGVMICIAPQPVHLHLCWGFKLLDSVGVVAMLS